MIIYLYMASLVWYDYIDLSDLYVDLSVIYVDLSDHYIDLSDLYGIWTGEENDFKIYFLTNR